MSGSTIWVCKRLLHLTRICTPKSYSHIPTQLLVSTRLEQHNKCLLLWVCPRHWFFFLLICTFDDLLSGSDTSLSALPLKGPSPRCATASLLERKTSAMTYSMSWDLNQATKWVSYYIVVLQVILSYIDPSCLQLQIWVLTDNFTPVTSPEIFIYTNASPQTAYFTASGTADEPTITFDRIE